MRWFSSPSMASGTYVFSARITESLPLGYPIRLSRDHRICAPPPSFSQLITAFLAPQLQGIRLWTRIRLTILSFLDSRAAPGNLRSFATQNSTDTPVPHPRISTHVARHACTLPFQVHRLRCTVPVKNHGLQAKAPASTNSPRRPLPLTEIPQALPSPRSR